MIIKEFLPNPLGKDSESEFIMLKNDGNTPVNLSGWYVADAAGKQFILSGILESGTEINLPYALTKIPLNNTGETVSLYNMTGELVDSLSYIGQAEEGVVISRSESEGGLYRRSEMLENWPPIQGVVHHASYLPELFATMLLVAVVCSSVALYAYNQLERNTESS